MKKRFEDGADVNGHLSKTIVRKLEEDDMLLDDWKIHHFHMTENQMDFFDMSRKMGGDLLFAVVLSNDVYFLQITDHGKDDFVDVDYLRIMKNNWEEELLNKHVEITGLEGNYDNAFDIKKFRKNGINNFIHEIDGSFYSVKYALGYTMSKDNMNSVIRYNSFIRMIKKLDFTYEKMEFCKYTIGCLCTIYDSNGKTMDIVC